MDTTFGSITETAPEGFLPRRIHFTQLAALDTGTKEGFLTRKIASSGFGTRELPLTITGLGPGRGHADAVPVGTLNQVRMSGSNVEGWGWLVNDDNGRAAFRELALGLTRGNSIEMVDVRVKLSVDWNEDNEPEIEALFTEANIGATTLVMKPAFKDSRAEIEGEITAALGIEGDLVVDGEFEVRIAEPHDPNLEAAGRVIFPHEAFTVPEPDHRQTIEVDRSGSFVTGHLGGWDECHTGWVDRCVRIPRSRDNYASFCKSKVPTTRGHAFTGPLILLGGHVSTREALNQEIAKVENVWADVVVVDGRHGPWMCGVVRPGVTPEALHAATASRVSGHWLRGDLMAICSAPTEGFAGKRATEYVVELDEDNEVEYLAASFSVDCGCGEPEAPDYEGVIAAARAALEDTDGTGQEGPDLSNPDSVAQAVIGGAWGRRFDTYSIAESRTVFVD